MEDREGLGLDSYSPEMESGHPSSSRGPLSSPSLGSFSAAPVIQNATGALDFTKFASYQQVSDDDRRAQRLLEVRFKSPQRLAKVYLQASGEGQRIRGGRLQYMSLDIDPDSTASVWQDAPSVVASQVSCLPERGPGFSVGAAVACWDLVFQQTSTTAAPPAALRWRLMDWAVDGEEKVGFATFGGAWLTLWRMDPQQSLRQM